MNIPKAAPKGLAVLGLVGPGLIWSSEMIGSGEVILTTRVGSILGIGVFLGLVGSWFAAARHMRRIEPR